jgi:hypothetical protein
MRAKVSWIHHLTRASTRLSNRLRAVLLRYYPSALQAFPDLSTQIALEFIQAYPTPEAAARLSWADFVDFAHQQAYSHPKKLPGCFTRLHGDYPQASPEIVLVYQDEAVQLASLQLQTSQTKRTALRELQALYRQHPDYPIFSSLPEAEELLGPALLAKFGDESPAFSNSCQRTSPGRHVSSHRQKRQAQGDQISQGLRPGVALPFPSLGDCFGQQGQVPSGNCLFRTSSATLP